ncbi:MAG: hypothetical protein ACSLFI_07710 [Solirubrobacterales bacterium]
MTDELDDLADDPNAPDPELDSAAAALAAAEADEAEGDATDEFDDDSGELSEADERVLSRAGITVEMREKLSRDEIRALTSHHGKVQGDVDQKLGELSRLKNPQGQNGTAAPQAAPSTASLREPVDAVLQAWPEQDLLDPTQRKQLRRGLETFATKVTEAATAQIAPMVGLLDELLVERIQGRLQERFPGLTEEQHVGIQDRAVKLVRNARTTGGSEYQGLKGLEQAFLDAADLVAPKARQEAVQPKPKQRRSGQPADPGRRTTIKPSQEDLEDRQLDKILREENLV